MVRVVVADRNIEKYLKKLATEQKFSCGLIVGQPSADSKDFAILLSKVPDLEPENDEVPENASATREPQKSSVVDSLANFTPQAHQALINHSATLIRMIPGSFYITGLFVVGEANIFEGGLASEAKTLLKVIIEFLNDNENLGNDSSHLDDGEKLFLYYPTTNAMGHICKSLKPTDPSDFFKPVDWKFSDKTTSWHMFETNYELDDVFSLNSSAQSIDIEKNMMISLKTLSNDLQNGLLFVQNEKINETQTVESFVKEKQSKKEDTKSFKATIYLPLTHTTLKYSSIEKYPGTIKFSGIIYSRIYVQPKNKMLDVQTFIRNDILRSLSSRIQIYCDALTSTVIKDQELVINESPRRVFFTIPNSGGIQFSEYIFRSEDAEVAAEQAKEMLDLDIKPDDVLTDLETVADYDDISPGRKNSVDKKQNKQQIPDDPNKKLYFIGIIIAFLILIVSIGLHLIFR